MMPLLSFPPISMAKKASKSTNKEAEKIPVKVTEERRFFCDRAFIPFNEEHFVLALQTGTVIDAQYAFTPKHMKRFLERLQKQIATYEKQYGVIKASLSDIK